MSKPVARSRETRHHRADRHANHISNLPVRETFQFTQDQHFSETGGQGPDGLLDQLAVGMLQDQCFSVCGGWHGVDGFVELGGGLRESVLSKPTV